jgi:patatin-like phospholipase/acyl hydrolase
MAKYRILALDGGGVRGVLTAVLMDRIDKACPGWRDEVDLIAGTSTGGLLSLGLGKGLKPADMVGFYTANGPDIFEDTLLDRIKDVGGLVGAPFKSDAREGVLMKLLGKTTRLRDLHPLIVVPAFDLDDTYRFDDGIKTGRKINTWKPKIFHNDASLGRKDNDGAELAYKVGMRTTAAPTYFPTYGSFIDGGVFANNPSMIALAQALATKAENKPRLEDLVLLNLGTGVHETVIKGADHDWGAAQWMPNIVDLVLDGSMGVAKFECAQLLGERFYRLSPYLERKVPMDQPGLVPQLIRLARTLDLSRVVEWVKEEWIPQAG